MGIITKAIIMAAGFGSRMKPLSLTTPKPLIVVNGKKMIETVIEGLIENNINEIYIVVGYLKEQFYYLKEKYNGISLIENPYYKICNNISSLYVARNYIDNTIILDGDQIIFNPSILHKEFEFSGYSSVYTNEGTEEWLQQVNNDNIVVSCNRNGGTSGWQLFSVSRWTHEDGIKLKKYIEFEFENNNTQIYWDDVPMFLHNDNFKLKIYPISKNDIVEIDGINELVKIDHSYSYLLEDII